MRPSPSGCALLAFVIASVQACSRARHHPRDPSTRRCLEWGSGVAGFKQRGLPAVLRDVEFAAVAMLDRWTAHFTPRTTAAGPKAGRDSESDKVVQFNNYLGIGIDAKVALDFHSMREAHPRWFMSQVGNKVWYGTLGATGGARGVSRCLAGDPEGCGCFLGRFLRNIAMSAFRPSILRTTSCCYKL